MSWACKCLNIELISEDILEINLEEDDPIDINLEIGTIVVGKDYPEYEGSYTAVPKVEDQIFPTRKRSMEEDFTVTKIPYQEVSNPQGGETVIIAFD